ncbi:MAG: periplasmic heavy metal sensor [Steroidobacteraceae bacterium]
MKHIFALILILFSTVALADSPAPNPADELAQNLFAPELVLKYRQEIGLDANQSKALKEMIQKAQSRFLDLQWDMQAETGKLATLLKARPIDSAAALAQVDRVLALEHDVKKAQLTLLIGIKNLLSNAQQDQLAELRHKGS